MVYLNPGGFNFGPKNLDGYGISNIAFAVIYSIFLYAACIYLWLLRHHPIVKMRKVGLMLMAVIVLHVFCFLVFTVYFMNGVWPCSVEFWAMNLYLPIGIGLFQAANQQLLMVSRQQTQLMTSNDTYKPLLPSRGRGIGTRRYWLWRFKLWYRSISTQGKYEGLVLIGMILQFTVSMIVYNISRKFNRYGIVSHHTSPALCRRGWEWAPSVIWQFLWNYFFGPYLLWKIHMIRDIYHWRLQTFIAVVAGLPGTPLWLMAVYTDKFAPVNKYWLPAMWFVPGMMAMEIVTVAFPIYQTIKHQRAAREISRILAGFDQKTLDSSNDSVTLHSTMAPGSLKATRNGKMHSMESLDQCLAGDDNGLQLYASCVELNGENIMFLKRVITFKQQCSHAFRSACDPSPEFRHARMDMFRQALEIFLTLVHSSTATYPINIESPIYSRLDAMFGPATALIALCTGSSRITPVSTASTSVTPWDDPPQQQRTSSQATTPAEGYPSFPLRALPKRSYPKSSSTDQGNQSNNNSSSEHIMSVHSEHGKSSLDNEAAAYDPLDGVQVPARFDESVFDAAFKSIRYMVWSETWQRYMLWKQKPGRESDGHAI
ncbi:MAG: hypothetical protein Q9211_001882 [Gyalolechia sp. 1 TL-2023]